MVSFCSQQRVGSYRHESFVERREYVHSLQDFGGRFGYICVRGRHVRRKPRTRVGQHVRAANVR